MRGEFGTHGGEENYLRILKGKYKKSKELGRLRDVD
jgi:hypothetical protein